MIDNAARTPLLGGGGREGFQHLEFAAPFSSFTPPSIFGAILNVPTERATFTLGIRDAQSAVQEVWPDDAFAT
jgi:porin